MQRILPWLVRRMASMIGFRQRKPSHSDQFAPHFYVRTLEERRVLNAAPVAPPAAPTPAPSLAPPLAPPPTATLVTLDGAQNLLIQDVSAGGQNDSLTIKADAAHGRYEIHDSAHSLVTEIAGASGSGSQTLYIPFAAIGGDKIIVAAAGGDDSLTIDYSGGELPQAIEYFGGTGEDGLNLIGGSLETVSYTFTSAGSGTIQTSIGPQTGTIGFTNVEPIGDQLLADRRGFSLVGATASATLASDGSGNLLLDLQNGSSVTFADARVSLAVSADTLVVGGQLSLAAQDVQLTALDRFHLAGGGTITSPGGSVSIYAPDLQIDGVLRSAGGSVTFDALEHGTLNVTGVIDVSDSTAGGTGGSVQLLGQNVNLLASARVDASGDSGGGEILIGGDYQGANPAIRNADFTTVAEDVSLAADGLQTGDGGKIIVWASDTALVAGSGNITARGGALAGNGGFVETSGKKNLTFGGAVDASAAHGAGGTWLIDPTDVNIDAVQAATITSSLDGGTGVTISTSGAAADAGNITVSAPILVTAAGGDVELRLEAKNDIYVNASIGSTGRKLKVVLDANSDHDFLVGGDARVYAAIDTNGGDFFSSGVQFTSNAGGTIATAGGDITLAHTGTVAFNRTANAGAGAIKIATSTANKNISFGGTSKLTGATIDLSSSGDITSTTGAAILEATAAGGIQLSGDSLGVGGAPLKIVPHSGDLSFTATNGDIYIDIAVGDLAFSQIVKLEASAPGQTVSLSTSNGKITVDSVAAGVKTTNDSLLLTTNGTTKDIIFASTSKLTAEDITLNATGAITVGAGGGTMLQTAGTNGVTLVATALGDSAAPLRLDIGPGHLAFTATSGDIFAIIDDNFSFSQITTLNAQAAGKTVSLRTNNGAIHVDSVAGGVTIGDDNLYLATNGTDKDIDFSGTSKLTAASANLNATGKIISNTNATILQTSAAAGVTLAADRLGSSADPLKIVVGSGTISLTATVDDIYVEIASGNLVTSQIERLDAQGTNKLISLATTNGTITVDSIPLNFASAADKLELTTRGSNQDILFTGATLQATSVTLTASGDITTNSATPAVEVTTGPITVHADSIGSVLNPLVLKPGSGTLSLTTTAGDIFVAVDAANLNTSDITVLSAAGARTVQISTVNGSITVDKIFASFDTVNDDLRLITGGSGHDIVFDDNPANAANTLVAASVLLDASGNISSSDTAGIDIDTGGADGAIDLKAQGMIGGPAKRIVVRADGGTVTAETVNAGGDIYLNSSGKLTLGEVKTNTALGSQETVDITTTGAGANLTLAFAEDTNDNWSLNSAGTIAMATGASLKANGATLVATGGITGGTTAHDVDIRGGTGSLALSGASLGTSINRLQIAPGTATVSLTATSGGIYVDYSAGDIDGSQLTVSAAGANQAVELGTQDGSILLNDAATFNANIADDNVVLTAGGAHDIAFSGTGTLSVQSAKLVANGGAITSGTAATDISASTGNIDLAAGTGIGVSGNRLSVATTGVVNAATAAGGIYLESASLLKLGTIAASGAAQNVEVYTLGGTTANIVLTAPSNSDDLWTLNSSGDISFTGGSVVAGSLSATTAPTGKITSSGGPLDIDTSAAGGPIKLDTGSIGTVVALVVTPVVLKPGTGTLDLTARSGGLYVEVAGGDFQTSKLVHFEVADDQVAWLKTTAGSIAVDSTAGFANIDHSQLQFIAGGVGSKLDIADTATLVARSVNLLADGAITGGGTVLDIDTSGGMGGAGGPIALNGQSLGAAGTGALLIKPAAGPLSLTATAGDVWLRISGGDLVASNVQTLDVAKNAATISLEVLAGQITLDSLAGFHANTHNDYFELVANGAGGNIQFGADTLQASRAKLVAGGTIASGAGANTDLQTTGDIDLSAALGIGAPAGFELTLASGGKVSAATTDTVAGDIYLTSPATLTLGMIGTSAGRAHDVQIGTTGVTSDLNIDSPSATNDRWTLRAGRNLSFTGTGQLVAQSVDILAAGAVNSGSASVDIDLDYDADPLTTDPAAALKIEAARIGSMANLLELNHAGGTVDLYSHAGDIWTEFTAGDLSLASFTRLQVDGSHDIYLQTRDGNITVADPGDINTADDNWFLVAGGSNRNIQFSNGYTLTGANVTLQATGKILSDPGAADDISATGTVTLLGDGGIGAAGNPLQLLTNGSNVTAKTTAVTGDIYLASPSALTLFDVTTDAATAQAIDIRTIGAATNHLSITGPSGSQDNWTLTSAGDIRFVGTGSLGASQATLVAAGDITSGAATVDIDTFASNGAISLTGNRLGASGNPLEVKPGTGHLSLNATGLAATNGVYVEVLGGDILGSQLSASVAGTGATLWLRAADGAILLDSAAGFSANTQDDRFELSTGGTNHNIEFQGATTLKVNSIRLDASGSLVSGTATNDLESTGTVGPDLQAVHAIGSELNPLMIATPGAVTAHTTAADGDIAIGSLGQLRIGAIATNVLSGQDVRFNTISSGAAILLEAVNHTNDDWTLTSGGDIRFVSNPPAAGAMLRASSATLVAQGNVLGSDAQVDIDTKAANGNITVNGQSIGLSGDALGISPGTGRLNLVATSGDLYVDIYGTDVESAQFDQLQASASGVQVALNVREGSLTLNDDLSQFVDLENDILSFTARDNVTFSSSLPLVAAQATIVAGQQILSTTSGPHIDTSAAGGAIALNAGGSIGALAHRVGVQAGIGLVTATTTTGAGDIYLAGFGPLRLGLMTTAAGTQSVDITSTGNLSLAETNAASDAWKLNSQGNITFELDKSLTAESADFTAVGAIVGGTAATDIDTQAANGPISLRGGTIGTAADALGISPGTGGLDFTTASGLWIDQTAGDLVFGRVKLSATGAGATVALGTIDGDIHLEDLSDVNANLADDHLLLNARGASSDIDFGADTLRVASAVLNATGSINAGNGVAIDTGSLTGTVDLTSGGGIGANGQPLQLQTGLLNATSVGDQYYTGTGGGVATPLRLGTLNAPAASIYLDGGEAYLLGTATTTQLVARKGTTLGGVGTIEGNLVTHDQSTISPGIGSTTSGVLTVNGTALLDPQTKLVIDLNAPYAMAGRDYDRLVVRDGITLTGVELNLRGAQTLQSSVNDITLIEIVNPAVHPIGQIGRIGAHGWEPILNGDEIRIGNFKSGFTYEAGDGNDLGIRDISITPPFVVRSAPPPQFRLLIVSPVVIPPVIPTPPPPLVKPVEPPLVEPDATGTNPRRVQVRILIPLDDAGNFAERIVLDLDVEWLTNLSGLFRVLPDDRYRIYLVLEGGEERRVMDVIVRDGKPFDPAELHQQTAPPVQQNDAQKGDAQKAARPDTPPAESPGNPAVPPQGAADDATGQATGVATSAVASDEHEVAARLPRRYAHLGAATAGAALALATGAAGRKWEERVDQAAEQLGSEPAPRSARWWRWMSRRETTARR